MSVCQECGTPFEGKRREAVFCSDDCRRAWNNRRQQRGAQLYDLFMCNRYERARGSKLKLFVLMCRLAARWYAEDGGRKTWGDPQDFIERNPGLRATCTMDLKRRAA